MLKFLPIILAVLYGLVVYHFSARRTRKDLDQRSSLLADAGLKRVTDRLASALDLPRVQVHLYEVDAINGLAAPDGRIFLTRGFYQQYKAGKVTAEELTSVIAHELGHVALGHTRRRMIDFSGQNALRTALGLMLSRLLPGIGVYIAQGLTSLIAARMSRSDEYEADEYAAALLTKAGIGIAPQISMFHKLEEISGARAGAMPAWLMSHPKTEDRISALKKLESRWT